MTAHKASFDSCNVFQLKESLMSHNADETGKTLRICNAKFVSVRNKKVDMLKCTFLLQSLLVYEVIHSSLHTS